MSFFWSAKKAQKYISDILYESAADHSSNTFDESLDRLSALVPAGPLDEKQFRLTLKTLRWSPRRIRNAVDTIRYGSLGAKLAYSSRRLKTKRKNFIDNNRYTLILGMGSAAITIIFALFPWMIPLIMLNYVGWMLYRPKRNSTLIETPEIKKLPAGTKRPSGTKRYQRAPRPPYLRGNNK